MRGSKEENGEEPLPPLPGYTGGGSFAGHQNKEGTAPGVSRGVLFTDSSSRYRVAGTSPSPKRDRLRGVGSDRGPGVRSTPSLRVGAADEGHGLSRSLPGAREELSRAEKRRAARRGPEPLTARSVRGGAKTIEVHNAEVRERGRRALPVYNAVKALVDVRKDRLALRELKVYLVFMVVLLCTIFVGRDVQARYQFETSMRDALIEQRPTFETVVLDNVDNFPDFWDYIDGVFVPGLCVSTWYNGANRTRLDRGLINNHIRPVGYIQFRQFRVRPDSCPIPSEFNYLEDECFAQFTGSTQETEPFGPPLAPDRYTWSSGHSLEFGHVVSSYGSGGYVTNVPIHRPDLDVDADDGCGDLRTAIERLKRDRWLDRHTSAVRIAGLFYNANKNIAGSLRILIESSPTGNLVKSFSVRTFRISLYLTTEDQIRLAFEAVFVAFVVYYIVQIVRNWIRDARTHRSALHFFMSGWAILDIAAMCALVSFITVRFVYILHPARMDFDTSTVNESLELETLAVMSEVEMVLNGINLILAFIRLFRYLRLSDRMSLLWIVMSKSAVDLVPFTILFFVLYIGFALFGHIIFGRSVQEWSTFSAAFAQLTRMLIGDLDYAPMVEANRVMAPIFFFSFSILIFFILVNMFLAIVNDAYSAVQERLRAKDRITHGLDVAANTAYAMRRLGRFLFALVACCGLCHRVASRRKRRDRDIEHGDEPSPGRRDGQGNGDGNGQGRGNGDTGAVIPGDGVDGAGGGPNVPSIPLAEAQRKTFAGRNHDEEDDEERGPREFFLWVTSGRTRYHRDLDLVRVTLERVAINNCAESGCFLPSTDAPVYCDSRKNGELHVCSLSVSITLDDLKERLIEDNPNVELPSDERFDHIIGLALNWIDLDIANTADVIQIEASPAHQDPFFDDPAHPAGAAGSAADPSTRPPSAAGGGPGLSHETANPGVNARLSLLERQNQELKSRLDLVLQLLRTNNTGAGSEARGGTKGSERAMSRGKDRNERAHSRGSDKGRDAGSGTRSRSRSRSRSRDRGRGRDRDRDKDRGGGKDRDRDRDRGRGRLSSNKKSKDRDYSSS